MNEKKKKSPSLSSTEVKIKIGRFSALYMRFLRIVSRPLSIATGPWEQGAGWWGSLCLLFQLLRHSWSWSRWLPPSRPIGGMLFFYRIQAWFLQNFVLFLHFFSPPNFSDFCSWSNSLMFSGWDFPWTSVAPPTHPHLLDAWPTWPHPLEAGGTIILQSLLPQSIYCPKQIPAAPAVSPV